MRRYAGADSQVPVEAQIFRVAGPLKLASAITHDGKQMAADIDKVNAAHHARIWL